jgi:hypothetical protein
MSEVDALATGAHVVVPCTVLIQIAGTVCCPCRAMCMGVVSCSSPGCARVPPRQEELDLVLFVPCNVHGCGVM